MLLGHESGRHYMGPHECSALRTKLHRHLAKPAAHLGTETPLFCSQSFCCLPEEPSGRHESHPATQHLDPTCRQPNLEYVHVGPAPAMQAYSLHQQLLLSFRPGPSIPPIPPIPQEVVWGEASLPGRPPGGDGQGRLPSHADAGGVWQRGQARAVPAGPLGHKGARGPAPAAGGVCCSQRCPASDGRQPCSSLAVWECVSGACRQQRQRPLLCRLVPRALAG